MIAEILRVYATLFRSPVDIMPSLAAGQDLRFAWAGWAITSALLAGTSVLAHYHHVSLSVPPPLPVPAYRLWQAVAMPLILAGGAALSAGTGWLLARILWSRPAPRALVAVCVPALWAGMWPILVPTDLAVALGWLSADAGGFPGLWVRELAPAGTLLYMLWLQWLVYWRTVDVLGREAFILAFVSLLPAWGWWAWWLR